jgi:hypothetical protein
MSPHFFLILFFYFWNFKWLWRVKLRYFMLFLSELWIDLCVKRMIICLFMKAIICFLISLTFRWTLNHIFPHFFLILFFYFWNFKWLWRVKRLSFKKVSFSSGGRTQAMWVVLLVCVYVHVFVYNKRKWSAGVRHSIWYAFSVGIMNLFVREKDEYMFLY